MAWNTGRNFEKIITEICSEENISMELISGGWGFKLGRDGKYKFIYASILDLNTSAVHSICCDKCMASDVMESFNIPHVHHKLLSFDLPYTDGEHIGNFTALLKMLREQKKLVIKANSGKGGKQVYKVETECELETAVLDVLRTNSNLAVSRYYEIEDEYRVIVFNGEIKLVFRKKRPYIVGDGEHTLGYLLLELLGNEGKSVGDGILPLDKLSVVLDKGEVYTLTWKHNLAYGARADLEDVNNLPVNLVEIANAVMDKMGIKFASVDIIKCGDEYKVLEINGGFSIEYFSKQNDIYYQVAKKYYKEAVLGMFSEDNHKK